MTVENFKDFAFHQHDVKCNQKYNKTLPYSFHLDLVAKQVDKFKHLLKFQDYLIAKCGAYGHDLIEDARLTYNDIKQLTIQTQMDVNISREVADVIYACTELRGRDRDERHGEEYIQGLKESRLGLFVKLCDISANIGFGVLTNSTMVKKYRKEFPRIKEQLYREEFDELFIYIEKLLNL